MEHKPNKTTEFRLFRSRYIIEEKDERIVSHAMALKDHGNHGFILKYPLMSTSRTRWGKVKVLVDIVLHELKMGRWGSSLWKKRRKKK